MQDNDSDIKVSVQKEEVNPVGATPEVASVSDNTPEAQPVAGLPDAHEVEEAFEPEQKSPKGLKAKLLHAWQVFKSSRRAKLIAVGVLLTVGGLLAGIPVTRYFILNNVGVRGSASITVLDETNHQPLKNVLVNIRGQIATTGSDGKAQFTHLKLGKVQVQVTRRAFAPLQKSATIGWGSNPLSSVELKAVGAQFGLEIRDWLSDKPIAGAEVSNNNLEAKADNEGKAILTVDTAKDQPLDVSVKASGYRTEKVTLSNDSTGQIVKLVSARKQPFISNRSGKYNLYKIDVDGKNEELVLGATGFEQSEMGLVSHPSEEVVAFVSTRDNVRNKDNFLLSTLTLVNLQDNSTKMLTHSERVQVLGWSGSKLLYAQITAGASASSSTRQRLFSYDYKTEKVLELASSNSFNDLALINGVVYYAPSNAYTPNVAGAMYKITPDATNKQTVLSKEVWNIFRMDYETLGLSVQQDWYQYKLGSNAQASKLSSPPGSMKNRVYADNSDRSQSLWIDERDGKGNLLLYDVAAKSEKIIKIQAGLNAPLRWLDNSMLVYRIHTPQETADYVISINGGEAKKIRDVIQTDGVDHWYYY